MQAWHLRPLSSLFLFCDKTSCVFELQLSRHTAYIRIPVPFCALAHKGNSMLIFPQGSREKVFARKGYSSIGAKLAEKAGVPVMPIAVKTDCEPTRPDGKGWFKDFGTVDPSKDIFVSCGPVIRGNAREMHAASFDWIKARLDSWGLPTEG